MFTAARVVGADSSSCSFVTTWGSGGSGTAGITIARFTTEIVTKGQPLPLLNESGRDQTTSRPVEVMVVSIEGKIKGTNDADNWTRRRQLAAALLPDQGVNSTPLHGTFFGTPPGGSELYFPYQTTVWRPVFDTEAPFVSSYAITLENPAGYWLAVADDSPVKA